MFTTLVPFYISSSLFVTVHTLFIRTSLLMSHRYSCLLSVSNSFACVELPLLMSTLLCVVPISNYSLCALNFVDSVCMSSMYGV
jgi:hypothetical protein